MGRSQPAAPKSGGAAAPIPPPTPLGSESQPQPQPQPSPPAEANPQVPGESVAERITLLQKSIEKDEKRLAELKAERDDPKGEYAEAEATFTGVDASLKEAQEELGKLGDGDQAKRTELEAKIERLRKARELTKNRFDLAIEDRRTAIEQIANLTQKLERDRQALAKLEGTTAEGAAPAAAAQPAPAPALGGSPPAAAPASSPAAAPAAQPAPAPEAAATPALPGILGTTPAPATTESPAPAAAGDPKKPVDKELVEAREDVQVKAKASQEAEAEARSITDRLASLEKDLAFEQKMLETARKRRENATESRAALTAAFRERSLAGAPREELDSLLSKVHEVEERLKAAVKDVGDHTDRVNEIHSMRAELQAERIATLKKAETAREQVVKAEDAIRRLENPFSLHNIMLWLVDHGPRMLVVLAVMALAQVLSRFFAERVIRLLAHSGVRGSSVEHEARARTLVGVFHNAVSVAVIVGGGMMLLQEAGIPIAPLLGGAAVFGLAVAFGAQNLIRDYFYGFVILLENQYKLNDVVQIGDLSGQVEKITLRMTVLRDLEGRVHFLPNGQVTAVTNFTHGWSRALFELGVDYRENVDHVIAVVTALAQQMRNDPLYGPMILEDVTMLGVDALAEWSVVIKFYIKTRPLQQWSVKREMLRRIKNRFDELGIQIPLPQRTVFYHSDQAGQGPLSDQVQGQPRILQAVRS
ncbi:mechanosensitive ion channel family protein [Paludisphaera rhizosphaerae]|uniref:mechanosensitive ion channel family protein n=1 Tax=Paludisphaera rhizosphaerae TaxID=2711216 RepID=UPI001C6E2E1E|nr:mechanosensitive ion channel domain-containing protein [Paludisphaera rhizosphaerae]